MLNITLKNVIIYTIVGVLLLVPISIFIGYKFESYLKTLPQKYCYQNFYKYNNKPVDNHVLIINNLKYKNEYISYYKKAKQNLNPSFNFPLIGVPLGSEVYIKGYTDDSSLVEIYVRSRFDHAEFLFYVIPEALHDNPPNLNGR